MINKPGNEQFIDEVTAIMREADPIFEKSGSSTRHYVRDLLLPMMEEKGLLIVRKEEAPQPVPAPKVGEEDPILTRLDIAVIKEKLTDEISEALDIPDGDYDMDYMRGRKAGLEWALKILLKRDRIPVLPTTPETEQPGEVPAETAVFKERWERAEANLKSLTEEDSKKQDALTAIIQACQHIKDNPNVAYILELAEKGINS